MIYLQTERDGEITHHKNIILKIGDTNFRLSMDNENKLVVNKINLQTGIDAINVNPSSSNEIKIS